MKRGYYTEYRLKSHSVIFRGRRDVLWKTMMKRMKLNIDHSEYRNDMQTPCYLLVEEAFTCYLYCI